MERKYLVKIFLTIPYQGDRQAAMQGKVKEGVSEPTALLVMALTLAVGMAAPAYAAGDPLSVINNLSDYISV